MNPSKLLLELRAVADIISLAKHSEDSVDEGIEDVVREYAMTEPSICLIPNVVPSQIRYQRD